eukprot:9577271-Lingulodinium_polyedra.AAC.1
MAELSATVRSFLPNAARGRILLPLFVATPCVKYVQISLDRGHCYPRNGLSCLVDTPRVGDGR